MSNLMRDVPASQFTLLDNRNRQTEIYVKPVQEVSAVKPDSTNWVPLRTNTMRGKSTLEELTDHIRAAYGPWR